MPQAQLTDLTRGLYHAAAATQAQLINQFTDLLKVFFDEDEDGTLKPKMVQIESGPALYQVPLISFVKPSGLLLKKMRVDLTVKIDDIDQKVVKSDLHDGDATRASFKVTTSPKPNGHIGRSSDAVDVELVFEADDTPEAVRRLIDELTEQYLHAVPKERLTPQTEGE
jgi:hypothetical protein